ncbi:MAG: crossover junction endodeoxyribonuclease RuvC [Alphaproteobacteria bacterium]|nr:crossover junction endodeoxyribonuclease RuvC [Alphaproteobacteria bacterium]
MRLIGLDPGLKTTGWGVVDVAGSRIAHVENGSVSTDARSPIGERLARLYDGLVAVIERLEPDEAAVEETFVNVNAASTLKLGLARGVVILAPARAGLPVAEYSANAIKKSVVGFGHAEKAQIQAMVRRLLPGVELSGADAADALALAICHAHHAASRGTLARALAAQGRR